MRVLDGVYAFGKLAVAQKNRATQNSFPLQCTATLGESETVSDLKWRNANSWRFEAVNLCNVRRYFRRASTKFINEQ
jgi:hypothetical protein